MVHIEFTSHLSQHVQCKAKTVDAATLKDALYLVFDDAPRARGYILDDQGAVRKHVAIFIDSKLLVDRSNLNVPLGPNSQVYVMQALSGG
ncbi:MAG: hypothetical protein WBD20_22300 [Pirellulaceae bacterium]